jgi:hypothetical protein
MSCETHLREKSAEVHPMTSRRIQCGRCPLLPGSAAPQRARRPSRLPPRARRIRRSRSPEPQRAIVAARGHGSLPCCPSGRHARTYLPDGAVHCVVVPHGIDAPVQQPCQGIYKASCGPAPRASSRWWAL